MSEAFVPDLKLRLPARRHGIALIGAGSIAEHGHVPAYRKFGLNVVGVASRTPGKAAAMGQKWGVDVASDDWRAVIDRADVDVVDITYPFDEERLPIVEFAAAHGKHVMMQKPLAHSMENARRMVEICKRAGVLLAVNQNARWAPIHLAAKRAIDAGCIGRPHYVLHHLDANQEAHQWSRRGWYARVERFQILEYAIHHLDLARWWMGREPTRVRAAVGRVPGQFSKGEFIATIVLSFADDALATLIEQNAAQPAGRAKLSRFQIDGPVGALRGEFTTYQKLSLVSGRTGGATIEVPLGESTGFSDAFAGTMGELMCAIEENRQPSISGEDNLNSLRLALAAYDDVFSGSGML
jgi:predicted dehydrogenase